ncbi:Hypothetical predicted protein [Olea europaea subsp. europaea]|uniref:Uncharacterized protein n=1 Tax=Olea europaea subsp. europaea TaxID=158383 RepID=A0A8S0QMC4_OLEEU|nr:Hypothetical predicted protein [Olea europaea subsp. europaea]
MVLSHKHRSGHQSTAWVPSLHHHHHHYHAHVPVLTNGGTGLKEAEGMHPGLGLHTMPTNCLEKPGSQATSLPRPRRIQDMAAHRFPETTSKCMKYMKIMLRPYRILDIACTQCPKNCLEMSGNQVAFLP